MKYFRKKTLAKNEYLRNLGMQVVEIYTHELDVLKENDNLFSSLLLKRQKKETKPLDVTEQGQIIIWKQQYT